MSRKIWKIVEIKAIKTRVTKKKERIIKVKKNIVKK